MLVNGLVFHMKMIVLSPNMEACMFMLAMVLSSYKQLLPTVKSVFFFFCFLDDELPLTGPKYNAVILDVDCKDQTRGLSTPPIEFLTHEFLVTVKSILKMGGK